MLPLPVNIFMIRPVLGEDSEEEKIRDNLGIFPNIFPIFWYIYSIIFGMPQSFSDAKTCITKGEVDIWSILSHKGNWISGRLLFGKQIDKNIIWAFFHEGGGPLFLNVYVRIVTKSKNYCENQKCSLGPKMQNNPLIFFLQKGGLGGGEGVCHLGKIPEKYRFFFWVLPLVIDGKTGVQSDLFITSPSTFLPILKFHGVKNL